MRPALAALLAACGGATPGLPDLGGTWMGACVFADATQTLTAPVELDIADGRGARLSGSATVTMYDGRVFSGPLSGDRASGALHLEAALDGGYGFEVRGGMDGLDIAGECRFRVPGGVGALVGTLELQR